MNGDGRNRNIPQNNGRAPSRTQSGSQSGAVRQNSSAPRNNGAQSGVPQGEYRANPHMQARRTVSASGGVRPAANGAQRQHRTNNVSVNNQRTAVPGAAARRPYPSVGNVNPTRTDPNRTASNQPAVQTDDGPLQMRSRSAAATADTALQKNEPSWFKRTFAVDKRVIEERSIVREKGSIDYIFLVTVIILTFFGTVMVYSASYAYSMNTYGDSYYIIFRQIMFALAGFAGMTAATFFKPEWYKRFSPFIYLFCFALLCLVPIIGEEHNGAKRWINIGFTEIQPSEFMKLGLVLLLAWYFDRYYERVTDFKHMIRTSFFGVMVPLVLTGVTCFMVLIEKHLSGTIIMFLIGAVIIFSSGTAIRLLVALGGAALGGLAAVAIFTDYTKRRIDIWLHPELDPRDGGYQTLQGLYAIGSGGLFGKGLGNSYQKHLFVSQPQNDFIYTIVCEELGFIGAVAVMLLFVLLAWRGFVIAMKAPDIFSALVVIGIVGKVVLQAMLNIAVVTNSIPNTGISLPFFSYGGSSLVVLMIEMGIVLSISRYSKQKK